VASTQNNEFVFVHIFEKPNGGIITVPGKYNESTILVMNNGTWLKGKPVADGVQIDVSAIQLQGPDTILKLAKK
jgi:hypothetical protein